MRRSVLCAVALLCVTPPAFAQSAAEPGAAAGAWRGVSFVSPNSPLKDQAVAASWQPIVETVTATAVPFGAPAYSSTRTVAPGGGQAAPPAAQSVRRGFTMLLNLGLGIQHDTYFAETAVGLGGLNLGLGGFFNEHVALMGRFSGTNVSYTDAYADQVSGVLGPAIQYWVSDLFHIEGGVGMGYWDDGFDSETGLGLILGAGVTVFHRGKHYLVVGAEYAPVFTDAATVHNFGFTFGYQFHR
jgi:hypothetical protein